VPNAVLSDPAFAVDSTMYQDLLEMEKKLDWNMMRKRAEISDALNRVVSVRTSLPISAIPNVTGLYQNTRTLRLFVSHTVSDQVWQSGATPPEPNFETGQGVPAWQLKIEGRLIEVYTVVSKGTIA
jgi:SWI/SNF-related matrix-associated actin-dependent regulator of chromatin subfamily D